MLKNLNINQRYFKFWGNISLNFALFLKSPLNNMQEELLPIDKTLLLTWEYTH